ncbi:hypothetical protein QLQ12_25425 [Actinoplanes sp. NEAU-A12]|uniref:Lipoprotein n=1 Tax=Actinoplanes sandaracinus TaxID=3045177 RepID=A0ABT6WQF8_9ACTN|nr:hypothetical protein [Actinoplanes sandaracinus]MDI6101964.1 hypothetical protein [Actinoplanes sandaracinus]
MRKDEVMKVFTKRMALAGALLFTGTALAACGGGETAKETGAAAKETAKPVSAATTLAKGVPTAKTPAFRYAIKGGLQSLSGVLDAPNKALTTDVSEKIPDSKITLNMKFLIVDDKAWAKIAFDGAKAGDGLPAIPKKWMLLDQSKLASDSSEDLTYQGETDPGYVSTLLEAAADLKEIGSGTYAGTTDLTKSEEAEIVDKATLTALGEKAKSVPLKLTVDAEGRIAKAVVEIPAAGKTKAATYEVTYDQYGAAAAIKAPTDVVKATADVYEMLNG